MKPKCIVILSMWRSGTSWLEDILGKDVEHSTQFGHEQQVFPLLAMMRQCWTKASIEVRKGANRPIDDIGENDFAQQLGLKFHKVLYNCHAYGDKDFTKFALVWLHTLLTGYGQYEQVVEKAPENLAPDCFDTALEVLGNHGRYTMVYLFRDFLPYLASCFDKFKGGPRFLDAESCVEYYTDKWLKWNGHAVSRLENRPGNLVVLEYDDLVKDPQIVGKFAAHYKPSPKVRPGTLDKWKSHELADYFQEVYQEHSAKIQAILKAARGMKIQ